VARRTADPVRRAAPRPHRRPVGGPARGDRFVAV